MATFATLTDTFDSHDTGKWTATDASSIGSGEATLSSSGSSSGLNDNAPTNSVYSVDTYTFGSDSIIFKMDADSGSTGAAASSPPRSPPTPISFSSGGILVVRTSYAPSTTAGRTTHKPPSPLMTLTAHMPTSSCTLRGMGTLSGQPAPMARPGRNARIPPCRRGLGI